MRYANNVLVREDQSPTGAGAMVEAVGLQKAFGTTTVIDGIDLAVDAGSVLALLGPNGAGKTTIVRILSTLLQPDAGLVRVGGHDVVAEPAAVRSLISLTGQFAAVDDQQTGLENLVMLGQLWHLGRRLLTFSVALATTLYRVRSRR